VIDVGAIRQEDNGKDAPVLVLAVRLECDFFAEGEVSDGVLDTLVVAWFFSALTNGALPARALRGSLEVVAQLFVEQLSKPHQTVQVRQSGRHEKMKNRKVLEVLSAINVAECGNVRHQFGRNAQDAIKPEAPRFTEQLF